MNNRCSKKNSLLLAWQAATQSYSEAVSKLAKNVGQVKSDDYERLKYETDQTRTRSADARNAFELHVEEHGC
jgi:glucan biosynthesis protein